MAGGRDVLPHLLVFVTAVFDYSHNRCKHRMLRGLDALYWSEGVISPLAVLPPVAVQCWDFSAEFRGNTASVRQWEKQSGFL